MYRDVGRGVEVFLVHAGGPYWKNRDLGSWTIPKGGSFETETDPLESAKREFHEETGVIPHAPFVPLGSVKQKGGKVVHAWAFKMHSLPKRFSSNTYEIEWPPRSGRKITIPEIDRWQFFSVRLARTKILESQMPFLDRLLDILHEAPATTKQHRGTKRSRFENRQTKTAQRHAPFSRKGSSATIRDQQSTFRRTEGR